MQVRRRRQRHATHIVQGDVITETDNRVPFVVEASSSGATGHLRVLATRQELPPSVRKFGELL